MLQKAYVCWNRDEEVRRVSSSGGTFYALATEVIKNSGIVFGARFNEDWEVVHDACTDVSDLPLFMSSKYLQSIIGNSFERVKNYLDEGKIVLFSGTPCQVAGVKAFLGKEYEKLITVDMICHGVPSPKVWKNYLNERNEGKEISYINFRDKTEGWADFSLRIDYTDGTFYRQNLHKDLYMKTFLRDLDLRPSCYDCMFKGENRKADLTLADFWAAVDEKGDVADNRGTSLLLVNTSVGVTIFESIKKTVEYKQIDSNQALKNNKNAIESVAKPDRRTEFFKYKEGKLIPHMRKLTLEPLGRRIKDTIKKIIRRK